jgi:enamine deaminase RidA (YjgF/YER057c/UK114 family)
MNPLDATEPHDPVPFGCVHVVDHDADRLAVLGARADALWRGSPPARTLPGVASLTLPAMLFEVDALAVCWPGRAH